VTALGTGSLMIETHKLLKARSKEQTLPVISDATGIPFYWLRKFIGLEVSDPSVNRVQKLYEYLKGRQLEL
jgi:hypothetical protein